MLPKLLTAKVAKKSREGREEQHNQSGLGGTPIAAELRSAVFRNPLRASRVQVGDGLLDFVGEGLHIVSGEAGGRDRLADTHFQRLALDVIGVHWQQVEGSN